VAAGRLVSLLKEYLPPPRPVHLIYPRDRQPTPKLTTFIDFITERLAPEKEPTIRSLRK
jgi:DNA-binding transcriptional LysR family regulator